MTTDQLQHGEYYHMWYQMHNEWILCFNEIESTTLLMLSGVQINKGGLLGTGTVWGTATHAQNIRPATHDEIAWLQACVEAKKFIPKPKGLIAYEIY